jgi:hypothetical protein
VVVANHLAPLAITACQVVVVNHFLISLVFNVVTHDFLTIEGVLPHNTRSFRAKGSQAVASRDLRTRQRADLFTVFLFFHKLFFMCKFVFVLLLLRPLPSLAMFDEVDYSSMYKHLVHAGRTVV